MFYAVGIFIPDPFLFVQDSRGERHVMVSALEIDRVRRTARGAYGIDHVHDLAQATAAVPAGSSHAVIIARFLHDLKTTTVETPAGFPVGLADGLRRQGISLAPVTESFWPERACKSPREVDWIREALQVTAASMQVGIDMIRASEIAPDGILQLAGAPLTSERVRGEIEAFLVRAGAEARRTIVAGGTQSADPHEQGSGLLRAHTPIILDIFPRMARTGYWGDMTRTVCRGTPPERLQAMWQAVLAAQEQAFQMMEAGVSGKSVHSRILADFAAAGFATGRAATGRQEGFFHGTGHGLGLEIHESPRVGERDQTLLAGHVVTVEPGLYYGDIGGVRLEDVVLIEAHGCTNLTSSPKVLEL